MSSRPIAIPLPGGAGAVQGTLFGEAGAHARPVLVAGALGVGQRYYAPFCEWLAGQGWCVLAFDLRSTGPVDMLDWARGDFAAAVRTLSDACGGQPVRVLGHSLGAHHAGMTDAATQSRISRLLSVAAGAGYWRDWAAPSRRRAPLMLHLAIPLLTPLLGRFPGRRLCMVGDLPGPAALQWARWCRHPGFAWGLEPAVRAAMAAARFPVHALAFSDDEAMTETCTRKLLDAFSGTACTLELLRPEDVGAARIGHLGAFRVSHRGSLWPLMEQSLH